MSESARPTGSVMTEGDAATSSARRRMDSQAFFDREAPPEYLDEWSKRLATPETRAESDLESVVIFRLHAEWLALPTGWLVEITDPQPIHAIPHRSNEVLLGLVNVRGQLRLCVSLHGLLGVDPPSAGTPAVHLSMEKDGILRTPYHRMIILRDGLDEWVFPAEEVLKVDLLAHAARRKPPSTFLPGSTHTQAVFDYHGRTVGLLDAVSLFNDLRSHCQ